MSAVFFTSDLHISHRRVAQLRADTAVITRKMLHDETGLTEPDPEFDIHWHDRMLAHNWDATINEDDHVWVCGDTSSGTSAAQTNALLWLAKRPGIKHLVYGNHDGPHPLHRDSEKWLPIYRNVFGDRMQMAARRRIPLADGGHTNVLLSHFPYHTDREGTEPRYTQWRLRDEGAYLIHGHTHSPNRFNGNEIHVGVDAWDFTPVPLATIVHYIQAREAARA